MKILLANPPTQNNKLFIREGRCNQEQGAWSTLWPPVSLATAGAVLENRGHNVDILDCPAQMIDYEPFCQKITPGEYDIVCWSTATPSITSDLFLSKTIKHMDPDIKTVVFGTHVTELADVCLQQETSLDFIIRNEPEETLAELIACLEDKKELSSVTGLSFSQEPHKICHNPPRPYINNLDSIPFPAWHLLDLDRYRLPLIHKKFLIISPIRGCPYPCSFCTANTYYGRKIRKKTVQRIIEEMEYDIRRFDISHFLIWADTFTADRDYVMDFCDAIILKKLAISWACNSRVDTVDDALLKKMAAAGCWMISYGIESGDQHVLNTARKNITLNQSRKAVSLSRKNGITVVGHFIFGLPGDSIGSINKTIQFAKSLDLDFAQFYCATPFPGSPLFRKALDNKWIDKFDFSQFRQDNAVMQLPGLPPEKVNALRKKAFKGFYTNPRHFFQLLKTVRQHNISDAIKSSVEFLKWSKSKF